MISAVAAAAAGGFRCIVGGAWAQQRIASSHSYDKISFSRRRNDKMKDGKVRGLAKVREPTSSACHCNDGVAVSNADCYKPHLHNCFKCNPGFNKVANGGLLDWDGDMIKRRLAEAVEGKIYEDTLFHTCEAITSPTTTAPTPKPTYSDDFDDFRSGMDGPRK